MLELDKLSAGYAPGVAAVDEVSLRVDEREVLALVGESGSGKSTIAKVLLGLLPDGGWNSGSVCLAGTELLGRGESDWQSTRGRVVGVVPQGAMGGLNPVARIEAQLVEMIRLHTSVSGAAAVSRACELVELVHLEASVLRAYPHQLSGGMRQRVAIALALAGEPPLLVADEPTTGLDLITQERILDLLLELRERRGMSLLVISHDLPALLALADRVAVMYAGRIVELAAADHLRRGCTHPYTKGLLGAAASVIPRANWTAIPGSSPAAGAVLAGCRFAPRCPIAVEKCHEVEPVLIRHGMAESACHRADESAEPTYPSVPRPQAHGANDSPVVEVSSLQLAYRSRRQSVHALRGVDLTMSRGEILGLVGESGSGKTTLGRVLLGLLRPTHGRATIDGVDLAGLRGKRLRAAQRRVGIVHQDPYGSLHPAMTVQSLVAEPLELARVPRSDQPTLIASSLAAAGLPVDGEFLRRLPSRLSGGQRQRVALARALAVDPILLVADEATSMLDVSTRAGIAATLRRLADERGMAVLFITHDLGEAMHTSDRVVVLRQGEIVEAGPPAQLAELPAHAYTAELIAAGRRHAV